MTDHFIISTVVTLRNCVHKIWTIMLFYSVQAKHYLYIFQAQILTPTSICAYSGKFWKLICDCLVEYISKAFSIIECNIVSAASSVYFVVVTDKVSPNVSYDSQFIWRVIPPLNFTLRHVYSKLNVNFFPGSVLLCTVHSTWL